MNSMRHFGWVILSISLLFLGGHLIPKVLHLSPKLPLDSLSKITQNSPSDSLASDSLNAVVIPLDSTELFKMRVDTLKKVLQVYKTAKLSRNKKDPQRPPKRWLLGHGIGLPVYILEAQRFLKKRNCTVLDSKERNGKFSEADFRFSCGSDTLYTRLTIGKSFTRPIASLAIIFETDSVSIDALKLMKDLDVPFALAINPFDTSKQLFYDLHRLGNEEHIMRIYMEPENYPFVNPGPNALYIHQSSRESRALLNKALERLPSAIGVMPRLASRALEHSPLMHTVFSWIAQNKLFWLEPPLALHPVTAEICKQTEISCQKLKPFAKKRSIKSYLSNKIHNASRIGNSIASLPLTTENILAVKGIKEASIKAGVKIVPISELMKNW